ncbi:hypothetical protein H4R24_001291 [Coemansia sp. RSA 988]|nr:hypothetical protein H4R24_001291 [Coemansia sp. RSA 988]
MLTMGTWSMRFRSMRSNTGLNDVLGDYILTLVDTLDTLAILGDKEEFARAVKNVLTYLKDFDIDSHVQVFEVTIRMLGGLLSAHIIATDEKDTLGMRLDANGTYNGELLRLARDLGYRLLPAFEASPNGTPYARTNLKHGMPKGETTGTCAAGAGTLLLEFGTLSRLTNETIFENVARLALNEMWTSRSKKNLFGNAYDISNQKWMHPIAGISAGVDSIYEYLLKGYVYFGDHKYLRAFDATYSALLQYSRDTTAGYAFYNVHMRSAEISTFWIDALSAFFPGMMVLAGDVDGAESAYMLYYHIWRRFHAMPERFNLYLREPDITYYLLRPEFIESTYYLYRATKDPFYLDVGEMILTDLNTLMRTSCGYTSIHDVRSHSLEERMDSFVLSETLKYLYLLFDDNNPLHQLDNNHVFTTEGHVLLPLSTAYDGSAQYPLGSSFPKRKLLHADRPPKHIKPSMLKVDNIRRRVRGARLKDLFALPTFPEFKQRSGLDYLQGSDDASDGDKQRKCAMPRALAVTVRYPGDSTVNGTGHDNQIEFLTELRSPNRQSPLEQLYGMQMLGRALQSKPGNNLSQRSYLLSIYASMTTETVPLRNDFYNVGALVYNPPPADNTTMGKSPTLPIHESSTVVESLNFALEFDGMCSVPTHLFLSDRHKIWQMQVLADVGPMADVLGVKDLPSDADTWLTPNTHQYSFTEYLLGRATNYPAMLLDTPSTPKSRHGVPLLRDLRFEEPDSPARVSPKRFYEQQLGLPSEAVKHMCATPAALPREETRTRRRGYPSFSDDHQQRLQQQRRFVATNGAAQVITDYVLVRTSADALPLDGAYKLSKRSHRDVSALDNIIFQSTNNQTTAQGGGAAKASVANNASTHATQQQQQQLHPPSRRPLHTRNNWQEYAGRLAHFSEMSLYRDSEPVLVPQLTALTMPHLYGSSAIYGCEEYTPREQWLVSGKVVAARAGGGCTTWKKAVHATSAGASALLVDITEDTSKDTCRQQYEEYSSHDAAINASGPGCTHKTCTIGTSVGSQLMDKLQHMCAWRTSLDDKCWPEDQYTDDSMSQELVWWRRQLLHVSRNKYRNHRSSSGLWANGDLVEPFYTMTMPVVIVDRDVINELESHLVAGRYVQVRLL